MSRPVDIGCPTCGAAALRACTGEPRYHAARVEAARDVEPVAVRTMMACAAEGCQRLALPSLGRCERHLIEERDALRALVEAARAWDRSIDWAATTRLLDGDAEYEMHDALEALDAARSTNAKNTDTKKESNG